MTTRNRIHPGDGDPRHGTYNGYGSHKCRCELCRAAGTKFSREDRASLTPPPPDDPRHGLETTFTRYGCRCSPCMAAAVSGRNARPKAKRRVIVPGDGDRAHGTAAGWVHHKCRCKPCRDAKAESQAAYRARRALRLPKTRKRRDHYPSDG